MLAQGEVYMGVIGLLQFLWVSLLCYLLYESSILFCLRACSVMYMGVIFNYETTCFGQKRPSSGFTPIKRINMNWCGGVGVEISTYHPLFTVQTMDI